MKKIFGEVAANFRHGWGHIHPKSAASSSGYEILHHGASNKSTAFTGEERDRLGLRGLLPHRITTQEGQAGHVLEQIRRKTSDIEKYIYLTSLQERNERLFYYTALKNIDKIMPLIYTPTVGEACKEFSQIFRTPRGLYITPDDKGKIRSMLDNWSEEDVRAIVVTDGQRILGLGDLGANGMGIPIGKLALYTICGGVDPRQCLPVMFDVGTNNDALRNDPLYLGYPHKRLEGAAYFELMEEFVAAVNDKFPKAMIQFEDFLTPNAIALLEKYRDKTLCFNDDIQGTAAVILAGLYASAKATGQDFRDMRVMFLGAGSASTGIADLVAKGLEEAGLSREEALARIWLVDSKGLVTRGRGNLEAHKRPYAQDRPPMSLLEAIHELKPQALIGATGAPGTFTQEIVEAMTALNVNPVIFALSNPTSHSECTAEQAYEWSRGRAIFASGSPFEAVERAGKVFRPGQGNNAYIFPGLSLGVLACEAKRVTDEMFLAAAKTLAEMVTEEHLKSGTVYPPLQDIRMVSAAIAKAVIKVAVAQNLAGITPPADLDGFIAKRMYDPAYAAPQPLSKPKPAPGL